MPLALLRPVFELLCGHFSVRERWVRFGDVHEWGAWLRPELIETYGQQHPEARLNDPAWLAEGPTTFINGRWLPGAGPLAEISPDEVGFIGDTMAAITVGPDELPGVTTASLLGELERIAGRRRRVEVAGTVAEFPWDLVSRNASMLRDDFARRKRNCGCVLNDPHVVIQGDPADVYIDPTAAIDPFVVIDARHGPVWVDAGARVLPFTRIEGPALIGRNSQLFRAHIREGTTIGPVCRVGGEIEESILHAYVNKYHDGFLGHAYVCPWVNLGAQTSNSDLKNDYSAVRVPLTGESIDTGSTKVGCFIGDHTKTAIGSLLNTGTSIGAMCLVLPDGELLPKHVPPFAWHRRGRLETPDDLLERGIAAARIAMSRRDCALTDADERLLRHAFSATQAERDGALVRQAARPTSSGR
ncbi:MAG: hypothetical protein JNG89_11895 [Planctomycetaceae bacterium]|nr:hypothetical protein [Planctomycetaceae bacterium]